MPPTFPLPCPDDKSGGHARCLSVIVLDAGQGDATLVVFPDGSLMLVDCGCKKNATIVTPEIWAVLGPYLTANQLSLRALVLTHPDGDHYNLVEELIVKHNVKVGTLLYGGRESDYGGLIARIDAQKRRGIDAGTQDMQQGYYNPNPDTDLSNLIAQGNPYNVEVRIRGERRQFDDQEGGKSQQCRIGTHISRH